MSERGDGSDRIILRLERNRPGCRLEKVAASEDACAPVKRNARVLIESQRHKDRSSEY